MFCDFGFGPGRVGSVEGLEEGGLDGECVIG